MKKLLLSCFALSVILVSCKKSDNTKIEKTETKVISVDEKNKAKFLELVEKRIKEAYGDLDAGVPGYVMDDKLAQTYREEAEFFYNHNTNLSYGKAFKEFDKDQMPGYYKD